MKSISKMNDRTVKILLYVSFAIGSVFCGLKLTVPGVLDEVGTLANTAFMAGDDWTLCVQSMGGYYYKYGQSVLYYPFYMLLKNYPYVMYPVLVSFQMLILSIVPMIAYHISRKYLKIESKLTALLISVGGAGISSIWLYAQYTRGDLMLIVLPWILALIFLKLSTLDKTENKKQRNLYSILLAFVSVYAYMAHSRGIVLVIATFIAVLFASVFMKKHIVNYLYYIPATGIFLVIDKILTHIFKAGVFGPYETRHASLESFDFQKFLKIFTKGGLVVYIKTAFGWILNLSASSMGLVLIGVLAAIFITIRIIRKRSNLTEQENILTFFFLMVMLGVFFMGSLFFFPHIYDLFMGYDVRRADRVIFGRYAVSGVGPICFLALYILVCKKNLIIKWKSKIFCIAFFGAVIAFFAKWIGPLLNDIPTTDSRYFLSLTALLDIKKASTTSSFHHLDHTMIVTSLIALGVFVILMILSSVNRKQILLVMCALVFALSLTNYCYVFTNVRLNRDTFLYNDGEEVIHFISDVEEKAHISDDYPVVYVTSKNEGYPESKIARSVKHYQYSLASFDFSKMKYIMDTDQREYLVIARKKTIPMVIKYINIKTETSEDNYYTFDSFNYKTKKKDIVFVKGHNLAKKLQDAGYKLTLFQ